MKKQELKTFTTGVSLVSFLVLMAFQTKTTFGINDPMLLAGTHEELKAEAFEILKSKCNVCHKKQNPFMIFSERNMNKRAEKINRVVFEEKRMPKGTEYKLTEKEYTTLKNWISTLKN